MQSRFLDPLVTFRALVEHTRAPTLSLGGVRPFPGQALVFYTHGLAGRPMVSEMAKEARIPYDSNL